MLLPEHEIIISTKHQSYLKILGANINDGDTVTWSVIRKAYEMRVVIVDPYKDGSGEVFRELNAAFQQLEQLIVNGTELKFDEPWSKLHTGLSDINASLGRLHTKLESNFFKIRASIKKIDVALDSLSESADRMAIRAKDLHASDDKFDIGVPFYLGCYTVFLSSVVFAISGKNQSQNARYVGALMFGAGLISTGSYLIVNGLFKNNNPTPNSEDNEQSIELKSVNSTN